jgi:RNAse (barnase) inhibitor barstar
MTDPHEALTARWVERPVPPWWRVTGDPEAAERLAAAREPRVLRGRHLHTPESLFAEFALMWRFPGYFGRNWSALEDCLTDLAWLPAPRYLCVINEADQLLKDARPEVLGLLLDLLDRVGRHWATPIEQGEAWDRRAVPFHTLMVCADAAAEHRLRARIAGSTARGADRTGA